MATSQNGYQANVASQVSSRLVPGTTRRLTVRNGAPGDLLLAWAAWFDKYVQDIDAARGVLDDWGYAERPIRGSSTVLSNHASGTAIDLNATQHPLGKRGTFTAAQVKAIDTGLDKFEDAIRWGGDYRNRADEMHFELVVGPDRCAEVLRHLKQEDEMPTEQQVREWAREETRDYVKSLRFTDPDDGAKLNLETAMKRALSDGDPS